MKDDSTADRESDWTPYGDGNGISPDLMPWEVLPGLTTGDEYRADQAWRDGVKLYRAPCTTAVAAHNRAALDEWIAQRKAERTKSVEPDADRKRKYAVGTLNSVADELAQTTEGCRDDSTRNAIWRLGGFVNDGCLTREEVTQAILDASAANGHAGGNKTVARIVRDIEIGLNKATHTVNWDEIDWHKAGDGGPCFAPPAESEDSSGASESEKQVLKQVEYLRVMAEARRRFDDESRPPLTLPAPKSLTDLLNEPDAPTRYRIDKAAPENSRIILSAQYKAGKTTMVANLLRSLADGVPFLNAFDVRGTARIVLIDDELSENMLRRWLRDQGIENTGAVVDTVSLRGKTSTFNPLEDRTRELWAQRLRDASCDYLILDCLRPVLDALGLDENHDVGQFLTAYDALLVDAGIGDSAVVHHMGHAGERSRGDSRLQDWPDATWKLVRETDEPNSPRYFSAYGRDVDIFEGRLSYDAETRRLSYAAGSRGDAKTEAAIVAIIELLAKDDGEGLSGNAIEKAIVGMDHTQKSVRDGIRKAIGRGSIETRAGLRNANLHRIANPCDTCGYPVSVGDSSRHLSCG